MKNHPKSCPTMFLLDLLYKTVLWCFLFNFMLISNGTGYSFIVFLYIKEEINFFEYFWKTCKKPLLKQNFSLIKVNFGRLWLKFCTNHWAIFSWKKLPNAIKNHPNGKISPNLVTLAGSLEIYICSSSSPGILKAAFCRLYLCLPFLLLSLMNWTQFGVKTKYFWANPIKHFIDIIYGFL